MQIPVCLLLRCFAWNGKGIYWHIFALPTFTLNSYGVGISKRRSCRYPVKGYWSLGGGMRWHRGRSRQRIKKETISFGLTIKQKSMKPAMVRMRKVFVELPMIITGIGCQNIGFSQMYFAMCTTSDYFCFLKMYGCFYV